MDCGIEWNVRYGLYMSSLEAQRTLRHVVLHHAKKRRQAKPTAAEVSIIGHGWSLVEMNEALDQVRMVSEGMQVGKERWRARKPRYDDPRHVGSTDALLWRPHASRFCCAWWHGCKQTQLCMSETWLNMSMPPTPRWPSDDAGVPSVDGRESFGDLVDKLSQQVPSFTQGF
jgi:hypothetical protein